MSMLTLNGIVLNVYDLPARTDKKTGEIIPASTKIQLQAENTPVSYTHLTPADERSSVDLGGRRIIKKTKHPQMTMAAVDKKTQE